MRITEMEKQTKETYKNIQKNLQKSSRVKPQTQKGITLLALVITIVLNCSYLAMDQMNKIEKI